MRAVVIQAPIGVRRRGRRVAVRREPVVMLRMIVPGVLVYVQRCRRGRCRDQGRRENHRDEPAHARSLLRLDHRSATATPANAWNTLPPPTSLNERTS